jgi:hypothetical protein
MDATRRSSIAIEAVLGHKKPGLRKAYDRYEYLEEKKDALQRWVLRLMAIVEPQSDNVVPFAAEARTRAPEDAPSLLSQRVLRAGDAGIVEQNDLAVLGETVGRRRVPVVHRAP